MRFLRCVAVLLLLAGGIARGQSPAQTSTPPDNGQPFTIHADSRVVLTDVTVQDASGNPVDGLPAAVFHITDNKNSQAISSFEEHRAGSAQVVAPAAVAAPHGSYSNDYLLHLPPVLNIVLIDIANIDIADQMYLNYQLTRFLNALPAGESLAIYLRSSNGCFLLQTFTTDRQLLLAALHKAIPRFPPVGRAYLNDIDALQQMSTSLDNLPGRKNLIWFSGGSTAYLRPDSLAFDQQAGLRNMFDELERERIALYPIDARGLTTRSGPLMWAQHGVMTDAAKATGGQAFFDNNGLEQAARHIVQTDGSYYTLTYAPHDLRFDNKWHKVKVTVDGGSYNLSYRQGYFADGHLASAEEPAKTRTRLLASGETKEEMTAPYVVPLIFEAMVLPASDPALAELTKPSVVIPADLAPRGTYPVSLRYKVPAASLTGPSTEGIRHVTFGLAAIALNREGRAVVRKMEQVTVAFAEDQLKQKPNGSVSVDQQLNLHKDDQFLVLAVWDKGSGRVGTLQVPLDAGKKK